MDFKGIKSDKEDNNNNSYDKKYLNNKDQENDQAIHYLTTAAYLHRITGEDIHRIESDCQAEQFLLDRRYHTTYQGEL
jgi:hypothetical protein